MFRRSCIRDLLLEVGYVGTRGTHLVRQRSLNQALSASANHPIRGVSENTVANISLRVPIPGVPPDSLVVMESEGSSWYNGLEVSLTKRLSHGLQFLASYTFSKTLDTDGSDINSTSVRKCTNVRRPKLSQTAMGTSQLRSHSSVRFQHHVDASKPNSRRSTGCPGRLVTGCNSNDSVRERA